MTADEVQAVEHLYAIAPANSLLIAASNNLPWKFEYFERYAYLPDAEQGYVGQVGTIASLMANPSYPASFLILTRSEGAYAELFEGLKPGAGDMFVAEVRASPLFTEVYRNDDADISPRVRPLMERRRLDFACDGGYEGRLCLDLVRRLTKTVGITVVIVIIALLLLKELARAFNERRIVDWMHVLDLALLPLLLVLAIIVTARLAELVH